jgi:hypothetical protein
LRLAKLVPRGKFRSFLSSAESNLGKHLDGNNVDRAPVQRAFNRDALSQVAFRPILRIEREDLPGRIVIQREARAGPLRSAFRRLGESFIGAARTVDDDAGP